MNNIDQTIDYNLTLNNKYYSNIIYNLCSDLKFST